jgi:hypothetical protein
MPDYSLKPTVGLVGRMTVQFAEGHWPEEIGAGVLVSDEAFDLIVPHLRAACPDWTDMHRYAPFKLPGAARAALALALRSEALALRNARRARKTAQLFDGLAEWLELHGDPHQAVSVLGY